jgi:hypothetical protein
MIRSFCILFCCTIGTLLGQSSFESPSKSDRSPAGKHIPEPPLPPSPVDYFKSLVSMNPEQRARELATNKNAALLQAKIEEYEALPPDQREKRLRITELWCNLIPLMKTPVAERKARLDALPEPERKLIEKRLEQWDLLPPGVQTDVFENKTAIYYFLRLENSTPSQREELLNRMPAATRKQIDEWHALPAERRQRMHDQFQRFFDLTAVEKEKTLDALSDAQRVQIEKSLQTFSMLPADQRQMCIDAFGRFANMSAEERNQFFKNAERWRAMTPRERETWISLVTLLPVPQGPPMPGAEPVKLPIGSSPKGDKLPALPGAQR